jgi:hypothetical protein
VTEDEIQAIENHISNIPAVAGMYAPVMLKWLRALLKDVRTAQERVRTLQDCGQDGPCVLSPGCQRHFLEHTRALLDAAEERGAKWAIDERGLHGKRDTRPMARELCERMRRSR